MCYTWVSKSKYIYLKNKYLYSLVEILFSLWAKVYFDIQYHNNKQGPKRLFSDNCYIEKTKTFQ